MLKKLLTDDENKECCRPGSGHVFIKVLVGILLVYLIIYVGSLTSNKLKEFKFIGRTPGLPTTLNIDAEGKVTATPDIATVSVGLVTDNVSAAAAQKENSEKMNKLLDSLKNLGIKDADLQTAQYSIMPKYDYSKGKSEIIGYTVTQSATVKIRDLTKVDVVLAKAGQGGANQVSGLTFTIDDPENLKAAARAKAISKAQAKAAALARSLGVRLVRLVSYNEFTSNPPVFPLGARFSEGVGGPAVAAPEIQPGSQEVTVDISVVYEVE